MPWGDISAFLVVLAGGLLSSWLVERILPFSHRPRETAELVALRNNYRRWQWIGTAVWLFVLFPILAVITYRILTSLAAARYAALGLPRFAFLPGGVEWGFPAVFLSAALSIFVVWLGVRLFLGPRYAEYRRYETLEWDVGRWVPWVGLFGICAGSSLAAVALLDCYAVFTADRIRINELLSAGERAYRYDEVRTIRTAPKWAALAGNLVDRREYVFCFQDGTGWSTNWAPGALSRGERKRLAESVAAAAEISIEELPVLTRKDQSCR
jgi:hypothetical protein